ncbi:MAG TPA: SAM-dependent chlorinase/fluorinase [Steroidobacteraceae bacterium]|nr:SAM-dependent chlorinase/fluorinase [Steroidobacteraceae bacterium]
MSTRFEACGVITLTTDFGLSDPFVGVMKGVMLARFASARIVDLTHGIEPYQPQVAGFWLARSFREFPLGAVHVAVVDPGVGTSRPILLAQVAGHVLLAPENGLLDAVLAAAQPAMLWRLDPGLPARLGVRSISATFHGRDIFAPVAAALASGQLEPAAAGEAVAPSSSPQLPPAALVRGRVITIDRFGNLITDIETQALARIARPQIRVAELTVPLRRTYGEVPAGQLLALINAFGLLEIALAQGNAAAKLGLGPGTPVQVGPLAE